MFEWCTQNLRRNGSISRGTSHATTTERYQYTTSVDINNTRYKKEKEKGHSHSFRITCDKCAVSLLQSKEERYIKAMNNNKIILLMALSLLKRLQRSGSLLCC